MNKQFLKELGVNTLLGAVVFGWVFGQAPLPVSVQEANAKTAPATEQVASTRSDQIPSVPQASINDLMIKIEPTAAPAPLPGLYAGVTQDAQEKFLTVVATRLKLRAEPSSQSKSKRVYPNGSSFAQIGQNGDWLQVRHIEDGTSGWMHGAYLQASN